MYLSTDSTFNKLILFHFSKKIQKPKTRNPLVYLLWGQISRPLIDSKSSMSSRRNKSRPTYKNPGDRQILHHFYRYSFWLIYLRCESHFPSLIIKLFHEVKYKDYVFFSYIIFLQDHHFILSVHQIFDRMTFI